MDLSLKKFTLNITSREKPNEKGIFLKRIGTLLEEGYSIRDALAFLSKIEKGFSKKWIEEIQRGMLLGHSFHEELENNGFPTKVCGQIYFAYHSGDYGRPIKRCGVNVLQVLDMKEK